MSEMISAIRRVCFVTKLAAPIRGIVFGVLRYLNSSSDSFLTKLCTTPARDSKKIDADCAMLDLPRFSGRSQISFEFQNQSRL
jgi:hypothetical protein